MSEGRVPGLRAVHLALADPLRIRLYELLVGQPQSARELAGRVGMRPDRLYHHLARLEEAKLIEVADYRRLRGGKVERLYAPVAIEPPADDASPAEVALLLGAVLETTRADVNAATQAQERGEERRIAVSRTVLRLTEDRLERLQADVEELLRMAREVSEPDGVWTTFMWAAVDRHDRRPHPAPPPSARNGGSAAHIDE